MVSRGLGGTGTPTLLVGAWGGCCTVTGEQGGVGSMLFVPYLNLGEKGVS